MKHKAGTSPRELRMAVYRKRDQTLKAMGYESYRAYLASDLWKFIRKSVLANNPRCVACGKLATQVHHTSYGKKDLEGRHRDRLVSVCNSCHRRCEFRDADGEKLNVTQATAKLKQMSHHKPRG